MKKWMIFLAVLYVLSGCKKEVQPVTAEPTASKLAVLLTKDVSSQRVMFNMLSNAQKMQVWQEHLTEKLNMYPERSVQWDLVHDLIRLNRPAYYQAGTDKKEVATTFVAEDWLKRAKAEFTSDELYEIAYSLNKASVDREYFQALGTIGEKSDLRKLQQGSPYNNEALPDCICAVGNAYTCPYESFSYTPYGYVSTMYYGKCTYNSGRLCDVEGGCGFIGWYLCDGNVCTMTT